MPAQVATQVSKEVRMLHKYYDANAHTSDQEGNDAASAVLLPTQVFRKAA